MNCPCDQTRAFAECCEPLLLGQAQAETPEALMRSRYTAYATKNIDYVVASTDPQTVVELDVDAARTWAETSEFLKLEILQSSTEANKGTVEFKAHFKPSDGPPQVHHEIAKFRKRAGRWYFHDGRLVNPKT